VEEGATSAIDIASSSSGKGRQRRGRDGEKGRGGELRRSARRKVCPNLLLLIVIIIIIIIVVVVVVVNFEVVA
jgi:hypothetical protein